MDAEQQQGLIAETIESLGHAPRSPVLNRPSDHGMEYENVYFPAIDGTVLDGWYIPANSERLVVANHFLGANKSGYPGHLEGFDQCAFEIDFNPIYKALHDAGYNVLAYDLRGHGLSADGPGGITALGMLEYRDVIGALRYARARAETSDMKIALYTACSGCDATLIAMAKHHGEFEGVKAMVAVQPISCRAFVEAAVADAGVDDAVARFDAALRASTGFRVDDYDMAEYARCVRVPTLHVQVEDDRSTKDHDVQAIFDAIPISDKKLLWIEGSGVHHEAYRYFADKPEQMLAWYEAHM